MTVFANFTVDTVGVLGYGTYTVFGFAPDLDRFPRLLSEGKSKREIANRAIQKDGFDLVKTAYRVRGSEMSHVCCLYVVSPIGDGVSKIGVADNPFKRLDSLQGGCWLELSVKAVFWFPTNTENFSLEYRALQLAKKEGVRLKGEWVDLDPLETIGLILTAAGPDTRFTDNHGLVNDWFPELHKQRMDHEDWFYTRHLCENKTA